METIAILVVVGVGLYLFLKNQGKGTTTKPEIRIKTSVRGVPSDSEPAGLPQFEGVLFSADLTFIDAKGAQQSGIVDIWGFGRGASAYIRGDMRMGTKSMLVMMSNISRVVDPETGEVIDDLAARLALEVELAPPKVWEGALAGKAAIARALIYIAKLDGQFSTGERAVVIETVRAMCAIPGCSATHAQRAVSSLPDTNLTVFRRLCGEISKATSETKQIAIAAAVELASVRKSPSPEQNQAVEYLKKRVLSVTDKPDE